MNYRDGLQGVDEHDLMTITFQYNDIFGTIFCIGKYTEAFRSFWNMKQITL